MYLVGLQVDLRYKLNTLFYLSYVLVPPLAVFYLWRAVLSAGGRIGDYDLSTMVTYYVVVQLFVCSTPAPWPEIGESIRNGRLAFWLVRPASHYGLYLARVVSSHALLWLFSFGGLTIVATLLRPFFRVQTDPVLVLAAVLLWLGGVLVSFTLGYLVNLLAFWTERVSGALSLVTQAMPFLAGSILPLDLLPLPQLWLSLPFRFAGWLPTQVYLGRIGRQALPLEFARLVLWLVVLILLCQWVWRRGLACFQGPGA
jgi:ABC-2 type transport system permease protein